LRDYENFDSGILHEEFDETFRTKCVVNEKAVLLVGPELEADVHAVRALIAGQLDEAFLVLEGDRNGEVVDGTASDNPADIL
jgi:hypothetical protein